jgi:hypothetical protein
LQSCDFAHSRAAQTSRPAGLTGLRNITRLQVAPSTVPDVENPNRPVGFVHFEENSVDIAPLAEEEASNLSLYLFRLSGKCAATW